MMKTGRRSTHGRDLEANQSRQRSKPELRSLPPIDSCERPSLEGQPLDEETRAFMEPRFGHDFSQVRIHVDEWAAESASALGVAAYTIGQDIVFASGRYAPTTPQGRWLLAHELTHVVQQGETQTQLSSADLPLPIQAHQLPVSEAAAPQEREARAVADQVLSAPAARVYVSQRAPGDHLWCYQAGESGHGAIEEEALSAVGFGPDDVKAIYFGNWLRDMSQLPSIFRPYLVLQGLSEFHRLLVPTDLGTYISSEHVDNPKGGGSIEDPLLSAAERARQEQDLSSDQRRAYEEANRYQAGGGDAASRNLPDYIERGKFHAKYKLAEAIEEGHTPRGMRALGDALHVVEDYYSHSNFVEVCLYLLKQDGSIPESEYRTLATTRLGHETAWIGTPDGAARPAIISGTYATTWDKVVSIVEVVRARLEQVMVKTGRFLGGISGAIAGGVAGFFRGGFSGAAEGWRTHSGLSALGHAFTGFLSGATSGLLTGGAKGYEEGVRAGVERIRRDLGLALVVLDEVAQTATAQAASSAARKGLGPTHSEIAKDSPDHPLFAISRMLAVEADREIGRAMQEIWSDTSAIRDRATIERVTGLVDKYLCYPEDTPDAWWRAPLIAAVKNRGH